LSSPAPKAPLSPPPETASMLIGGRGPLWPAAALAATSATQKATPQRQKPSTDTGLVKYEFGRPVRQDEQTYDWYRTTHANEAAARYGVSASEVGDGMDTWHWWVGVDNPGYWRQNAIAASKASNLLGINGDLLRLLITVPRNKRFELVGLINDPDTVAAEKPDQYGLMIDRMKAGTLKWDPEKFGYSSGVFGLQLFVNIATILIGYKTKILKSLKNIGKLCWLALRNRQSSAFAKILY